MNKETTLLYSTSLNEIAVLIPRKHLNGYLKAPFGGSHTNEKYKEWMREVSEMPIFSTCDLDGYLSIGFLSDRYKDHVKNNLQKVIETLIKLFPQITDSKEISLDEFYNATIKNK